LAENLLKKYYIRKKKQKYNRSDLKNPLNVKSSKVDDAKKEKKHETISSSSSVSLNNPIEDNNDDNEINSSLTANGRRKIIVKTNFNNLLKSHQRNTLKRQDESVEEDEEAELQTLNSNFNKSTENLIKNDEIGNNLNNVINNCDISSNNILLQSASSAFVPPVITPHLTNIIEDEEDILSQITSQNQPHSNQALNIKSTTTDSNSGIAQFTSNLSISRRSSRGGNTSDNALSSLTIPEEAENDTNVVSLSNLSQIKKTKLNEMESSGNNLISNYFISLLGNIDS
jgi:3-dehydroquinate dehydratase